MTVHPAKRTPVRHRSLRSPTAADVRRWALAALVVNAGITVTGAVVRITGSGLGCPTWPRCTPDSFLPAAHAEHAPLNMAIEFGNRLLTFLLLAVAAACVIAAHRLVPRRRDLVRLAWLQPAGVAAQALWGGAVVHSVLHPVTVGVHFLLSIAMIAAAVALYARSGEGDAPPRRLVHPAIHALGRVLVGAVLVLVVLGVVVTGTGPHSGDVAATRFDFDIETVARIHADAAYVAVGLTFALVLALHVTGGPARARRGALVLLGLELAQGVVGYTQYFLGVPEPLVGLHVLGSALIWIATVRLVFLLRSRDPHDAPARPDPAAALAG